MPAPHGTMPPRFPVFSKPIVNLKGMGVGSRVLHSRPNTTQHYAPGHFWMTLLARPRTSVIRRGGGRRRAALVAARHRQAGRARARSTTGRCTRSAMPASKPAAAPGCAGISPAIPACSTSRPSAARIIEAHLRFADQWPDLYGAGWVEARRAASTRQGDWDFADDADRRDGYSVVLFGPNGVRYRHPPAALVEEVKRMPGVTSVQITFHEDRDAGAPRHAARRLPPRHRQRLRSAGGACRAGAAQGAFSRRRGRGIVAASHIHP